VLRKVGNLDSPEKMRTIICSAPVSEGRKELYANAVVRDERPSSAIPVS
jgi:hypothetical protein